MHLHPRRHLDGTVCSPAEHPDCSHGHHYPKHRAEEPPAGFDVTRPLHYPRHRARVNEFGYMVTTPPRNTR